MKTPILNILESIEGNGEFVMNNNVPITLPGLEVAGIGEIGFPITEPISEQMIKIAHQAAYGKGSATIVDTSVRNVWEIDAQKISFKNPKWEKHIGKISEEITKGLGINEFGISMNLYKLLIYETGSFFLPHKDSEKEKGMFGTAIINLPSQHEGGELYVRFDGKEKEIDFSDSNNLYQLAYAAFFADCEHEIKPIQSGYRICLVYNLIQKVENTKISVLSYNKQEKELVALLTNNTSNFDTTPKLIMLDHEYTETNFSIQTLKHHDKPRAKTLIEAANLAGYMAFPALLTKYVMGEAEYDYDGYGYSDDTFIGMGEIYEEDIYAEIQHDNSFPPIGKISISESDVISRVKLDDGEPSDEEEEGYTGNAGMTVEYWYHHGAIAIWPKAKHIGIINKLNIGIKLGWLSHYSKDLQNHKSEISDIIISINAPEYGYGDSTSFDVLVNVLVKMKDEKLVYRKLSLLQAIFTKVNISKWVLLFKTFGVEFNRHFYDFILQKSGMPILLQYIKVIKEQVQLSDADFDDLIKKELSMLPSRISKVGITSKEEKDLNAEAIGVIVSIGNKLDESTTDDFVTLFCSDNQRHYVNDMLATNLVNLKDEKQSKIVTKLHKYCLDEVQNRVNNKPIAPATWKKEVPKSSQNTDYWDMLKDFLQSETQTEYDYRARQDLRSSLESIIRNVTIDLKMQTINQGSPHILRLTKTHASYDRDMKKWKEDCLLLEKLNG